MILTIKKKRKELIKHQTRITQLTDGIKTGIRNMKYFEIGHFGH